MDKCPDSSARTTGAETQGQKERQEWAQSLLQPQAQDALASPTCLSVPAQALPAQPRAPLQHILSLFPLNPVLVPPQPGLLLSLWASSWARKAMRGLGDGLLGSCRQAGTPTPSKTELDPDFRARA